jgi:Transposase
MSVYVGIDVHRKRSQVAMIDQDGEVLANRNVPNGVKPILSVIGGLPAGTPAAVEAAFGWGWLVELLEDYGFDPHLVHPLRCKAIAYRRVKNDLLTELRAGLGQVSGQAGISGANVCRHDHWRRSTAGVVRSGGAAVRFACDDRGSV